MVDHSVPERKQGKEEQGKRLLMSRLESSSSVVLHITPRTQASHVVVSPTKCRRHVVIVVRIVRQLATPIKDKRESLLKQQLQVLLVKIWLLDHFGSLSQILKHKMEG